MMVALRGHKWTRQEYLAFEGASEFKHEFINGEVVDMAGGSATHSRIKVNLTTSFENRLAQSGCIVYDSDMRVRAGEMYAYPDLSVVCGTPLFEDDQHTLLNPILIVEVLSPSTEAYDRKDKFKQYRSLPTLEDYVLVAQDEAYVEHFHRQADGTWILAEMKGMEAEISLPSLSITLPLATIYNRVTFGEAGTATSPNT